MSTRTAHTQFNGHETLLRDPHQTDWRGDTRHDAVANDAALIQNHFELDSPPVQQRCNVARALTAPNLLIMPIGDVDRPLRLESLSQQHLDRLENADNG